MSTSKLSKMPLLAGALVLQVALAALLFWNNSQNTAGIPEPLIAASAESITKIVINGEDSEVTLLKEGDTWQDGAGLPVDSPRVISLVEQLTAIKSGFPVASTASAQQRFEVEEKNYQRKITVTSDSSEEAGASTTLYFGKNLSYKQVHVRPDNHDSIYAATFSVFDAPTSENAWLDTKLLQPKGEVTAIKVGDFSVAKANGQWPQSELGDNDGGKGTVGDDAVILDAETGVAVEGEQDTSVIDNEEGFSPKAFVEALAGIQVMGVVTDIAELDSLAEDAAKGAPDNTLHTTRMQITTTEGAFEYELLAKESEFFIRRGDYGVTFRLGKPHYDALIELAKQAVG